MFKYVISLENSINHSGIFSISFTDYDPEFAQKIVNYSVNYIEKLFLEFARKSAREL